MHLFRQKNKTFYLDLYWLVAICLVNLLGCLMPWLLIGLAISDCREVLRYGLGWDSSLGGNCASL